MSWRDTPTDDELRSLFEAIAAAKHGRPGAGAAALDLFCEIYPAFDGDRPGAEFIAQRRPIDYYPAVA
jgi:hypothetical protein